MRMIWQRLDVLSRSVCDVSPAFRHNNQWTVKIDKISKNETVSNRTDVQLFGKRAFIGGRPGFNSHHSIVSCLFFPIANNLIKKKLFSFRSNHRNEEFLNVKSL